jgi:hypothetical protein
MVPNVIPGVEDVAFKAGVTIGLMILLATAMV